MAGVAQSSSPLPALIALMKTLYPHLLALISGKARGHLFKHVEQLSRAVPFQSQEQILKDLTSIPVTVSMILIFISRVLSLTEKSFFKIVSS